MFQCFVYEFLVLSMDWVQTYFRPHHLSAASSKAKELALGWAQQKSSPTNLI